MSNFNLDMAELALRSGDYGWTESVSLPKNYWLVELETLRDKVDAFMLAAGWRGTGHSEWEWLLALALLGSVQEAYNTKKNEVNITRLFSRNLTASRDRVFTKEQVAAHILPFFTVVREDAENIYLKLKVVA